jgi:neutral ceramidase
LSGFRAGSARTCISPQIGCHIAGYFNDRIAADIQDDLYTKALVFENGSESLAIVVCDLIVLLEQDIKVLKQRASFLSRIPEGNIFVSCTHTHFGPATTPVFGTPRDEIYMERAMERAADSVKLAQTRLEPAEVGVASASVPGENFNRRWLMKDGRVRMNPGYLNPNAVRPMGPTDPQLLLLAVRDQQRRPIGLLANYSLHYVGGPYDDAISADYFGHFDRALQRLAGAPLVGIMANGFCGDINNCDFAHPAPDMPSPTFQAERVANVLAGAAYSAWQGLRGHQYNADPELRAVTEVLPFKRRQSSEAELKRAMELVTGAPLTGAEATSPLDARIFAQEALAVAKEPVERPSPIMALRVGDLGVVGLPGEIFVEYGLQIKKASPFANTMTVELANDYVGYCPTDKALTEGSYETTLARSAKAAPGTEGTMVAAALAALSKLA